MKKTVIAIVILMVFSIAWYILKPSSPENKVLESNTTINNKITKVTLSESLTITESGIYELTGNIEDGLITIHADGEVILVLNNVIIKNSKGPAIYIEQSAATTIELTGGTVNQLTDSDSYSIYKEDVNGTIFSRNNLIITGKGTLKVNADYKNGIVSKGKLTIESGTIEIDAVEDGIQSSDNMLIKDGIITINSAGNGIRTRDDTRTELGYIQIENGIFNIRATLDGIQANTYLSIKNGSFDIRTGNGSSTAWTNQTISAKALKSKKNLIIENGTFTIDSADDAIHTNSSLSIIDGVFHISSGDDGIHADNTIIINNGTITITKSYEGIESASININGGTITITASDDGINASGGSDNSSQGGRAGQNQLSTSTEYKLTLNGGMIEINASGDGLDANGNIYINGGEIYVNSSTNDKKRELDSEYVITGGTLMTIGTNRISETTTNLSTQFIIILSTAIKSNDKIVITDSKDNELFEYTIKKQSESIVYSSPLLKLNESYKLKINDAVIKTFNISSNTTVVE